MLVYFLGVVCFEGDLILLLLLFFYVIVIVDLVQGLGIEIINVVNGKMMVYGVNQKM